MTFPFKFEFKPDTPLEDILGTWTVESYQYGFYLKTPEIIFWSNEDGRVLLDAKMKAVMLA
jgi:hypothetical protein